jgi:methylated-DNA-[protein]-cysteine S-methyltransferase
MTSYEIYSTRFGEVAIAADDEGIVALGFHSEERPMRLEKSGQRQATELTDLAAQQLEEYFAGQRRRFELPLNPRGTDFQQGVWRELCRIPYGQTRSYSEQAQAVGNVKAVRAVARANGANPIAIVVPCHRVIGADGTLTGYAGGLEMKARLLTLEGAGFLQQAQLL